MELVRRGGFGKYSVVAYDTETKGLYGELELAGVADESGVFIGQKGRAMVRFRPRRMIAGHNIKYDIRILAEQNKLFSPENMVVDTMAGTHLLNENAKQGLKAQAAERMLFDPTFHSHAEYRKWQEEGWHEGMSPEELATYLKSDVFYTRKLAKQIWTELKDEGLLEYWLKLECPMAFIAAEMEVRGIRVDGDELAKRARETDEKLMRLESAMKKIAPGDFWKCPRQGCKDGVYHWKKGNKTSICKTCDGDGYNKNLLSSPKQLEYVLFTYFGLEPVDYTDKGNPSTRHESLVKLRDQASGDAALFIDRLLEYREANKLLSAFYLPYLLQGSERIHPNLKPWGTVTGRWACDSPNLQQVPKEVRSIFVPDEGMVFISVDYTQLELYLSGVIFNEPFITQAYERGENLHQRTADLAGVEYAQGKTINFALLYGLSAKSLASRLNVSKSEAARIIQAVNSGYSGLFEGIEAAKQEARDNGYVTTYLGRKRRIPAISSSDFKERIHAENQAVNAKIQGTAAELIKSAAILAKLNVPEAYPVLQVHDEVLFLAPKSKAVLIAENLRPQFEGAILGLSPKVDIRILERWS